MQARLSVVLATACLGAGVAAASPTIHQVTASDAGLAVNCYLVEGDHGVVAIDSALTVSDGAALRKQAAALGKPIVAVLITHGHPDHYNGVAALIAGRKVPIYATAAVTAVIKRDDAAKDRQWKPVFKAEWPATRVFPDHVARDGEPLVLDGMTFVAHDLGPAESHADSYWELRGERAAFVGDQVLAGSFAYTNDGHTAAWLADLDRLARELKDARIYPGHGAPGDASLFAWQKAYLTMYRKEVEAVRHGAPKLSDAQKQVLVEHMKAAYPTAKLEFMISLGADTTATELSRAP